MTKREKKILQEEEKKQWKMLKEVEEENELNFESNEWLKDTAYVSQLARWAIVSDLLEKLGLEPATEEEESE